MEKRIIQIARVVSALFMPFYAPTWAFLWLLFFSYLRLLPMGYKLLVLGIVVTFTVLIPMASIYVFRRLNRWSRWQLSHRQHRHMPYVLSLMSYGTCLLLLLQMNTATFFRCVITAAIAAQILAMLINLRWKISTHMVGMGGLVGLLIAFSHIFYYNPLWPTCGLLILAGLLGTSRMILRQHSLAQVLVGFLVGFVCAITFTLFIWI
ncbi:MAG: hypothetical protein K5778_04235 [Bacteroidaceae bacterium]|nr:hypothetical protein [Bacteroidaceae bacterium]